MRNHLFTAVAAVSVALVTGVAPAHADTVFSENFDTIAGGNFGVGQHVGQFTVMQNDVDVIGASVSPWACPSPNGGSGNGCVDLNGNANGMIVSDPLQLNAGQTYTVSFKMAGNGMPSYPSSTYPYTFDVTLGGDTRSFSIAPLATFQDVSFDVVAASPLPVSLVFRSTYSGVPSFWGAIIDDVAITTSGAATPAVPEPATWAMMIIGFGLVGGAMRRRTDGRQALA